MKVYLVSLFCIELIITKERNVNMSFCSLFIHWKSIIDTKSVADTTNFAIFETHSPI